MTAGGYNIEYAHELIRSIIGLKSGDDNFREVCINFCEQFAQPTGFDWNVFTLLVRNENTSEIRMFAYSSLIRIIKDNWNRIDQISQFAISSSFPFLFDSKGKEDVIYNTIARVAAAYLAYAAPGEQIDAFFLFSNDYDSFFRIHVLVELISFIFLKDFPKNRFIAFKLFNDKCLLGLLDSLLFGPLLENCSESYDYNDLLQLFTDIHVNAPNIVEKAVSDSKIKDVYAELSTNLWTVSDTRIVTIFEALLEFDKVDECVIRLIDNSMFNYFLNSFRDLFVFNKYIDREKFDAHIQSFQIRIQIMFSLIFKVDESRICDFLSLTVNILESISPSVVYETVVQLINFFRSSLYVNNHQLILSTKSSRLEIINICFVHLMNNVKNLPGCLYDDKWPSQKITSLLEELIKYIIETFDNYSLLPYIMSHILYDKNNTKRLLVLIKIVGIVLSNLINKIDSAITGTISVEVSISLLSSIHLFIPSVQSKVFAFLGKLVPFCEFSEYSQDDFFDEIITLLLESRPISFEAFSSYITHFVNHHTTITIAESRLKNVPGKDPAFSIVSKLMAKFIAPNKKEYAYETIITTINDFEWISNNFVGSNSCLKRIRNDVTKGIDLLLEFDLSSIPKMDIISSLCLSLIKASNRLISVYNDSPADSIPNQIINFVTKFSSLVMKTVEAFPGTFFEFLRLMKTPSSVSMLSFMWVKKIGQPVLEKFIDNPQDLPIYLEFCSNLKYILESIINNNDIVQNGSKYSKTIASCLCQFSVRIPEDQAYNNLCLCLQIDDYSIFSDVLSSAKSISLNIFVKLWPLIEKRSDNQYLDRVVETLYEYLVDSNNCFSILKGIPSFSKDQVEHLKHMFGQAKIPKSKKRVLRMFLKKELK